MKEIVVLGSVNTDMVVTGSRLPSPGETICDGELKMHPGGKGANQAVSVARLSGSRFACELIAKVGDDSFGRETAERLRQNSILPKLIIDPVKATGTALIMVDREGRNVISVALGANGTLSVEDIQPYKTDIEQAKILLVQLETPLETVAAAASWAKAANTQVVLRPAPAVPLSDEFLSNIDWITPCEADAEILTGIRVTDVSSARKASQALLDKGVGHVILTMGVNGCYCSDTDTLIPVPQVESVDCVAGYDVFNGGLGVALSEGREVADAIAFAMKASLLSVMRSGGQPSIPYRKEVV